MPRLHITPVVLNLIIINVLVFIGINVFPDLQPYFQLDKVNVLGIHEEYTQAGHTYFLVEQDGKPYLGPEVGSFKPVQIVTVFFSHTAVWHIAMNMYALFLFGVRLEMALGPKRFLLAYLSIGLLSSGMVALLDPSPYPIIGASGALFGISVLFAYYYPAERLGLMFIPVYFPIRKFLLGAFVISVGLVLVEVFTGTNVGGISHFGHAAGMVAGFLYLQAGKLRKMKKE